MSYAHDDWGTALVDQQQGSREAVEAVIRAHPDWNDDEVADEVMTTYGYTMTAVAVATVCGVRCPVRTGPS